jgi:UDP-galactopyranose mutase
MRILVVGAGLAGSSAARDLAEAGHEVTVIDRRHHVAGNTHDHVNLHGIRMHTYGAHIFHTNNRDVWDYLSRFTQWIPYQHRVKAMIGNGELVNFPLDRKKINELGIDRVLDIFFRPYTRKMWGIDLENIDHSVADRILSRTNDNGYYFPGEKYQVLPANGYVRMVENMLDHNNITLNIPAWFERSMESDYDHVFNCMPIDEYYGYSLGELPYRSIKFRHVDLPMPRVFDVSVINFTHDGPETRIIEWKNLPGHGENDRVTTLTYEIPCDYKENGFERYYPIKDADGINRALYRKYADMTPSNVTFIGRCGLYVYIDMHQAISSSRAAVKRFLSKSHTNP